MCAASSKPATDDQPVEHRLQSTGCRGLAEALAHLDMPNARLARTLASNPDRCTYRKEKLATQHGPAAMPRPSPSSTPIIRTKLKHPRPGRDGGAHCLPRFTSSHLLAEHERILRVLRRVQLVYFSACYQVQRIDEVRHGGRTLGRLLLLLVLLLRPISFKSRPLALYTSFLLPETGLTRCLGGRVVREEAAPERGVQKSNIRRRVREFSESRSSKLLGSCV